MIPRPKIESRNTDNTLTVPDKTSKKTKKSESTMGKKHHIGPENLKKCRSKRLVKSNKSIS